MNNSEVPLFLQHKLDQWQTSIELFISRQSTKEIINYAEKLIHTLDDPQSSPSDALVAMLALFSLIYVWMKMMRSEDYEDEDIDD